MTSKQDFPPAKATTQVDNDRVRVVEWRFAPGEATGWHRHGWDYVVVPMTDGKLRLLTPTGEVEAMLVAGQSYYRRAGVEHNVVNGGDSEIIFIETEIKAHPEEN